LMSLSANLKFHPGRWVEIQRLQAMAVK
jgi:hypothetical protein